jgi:hypothetical protein
MPLDAAVVTDRLKSSPSQEGTEVMETRHTSRTGWRALSARAKITSGFSESFRRGIVTLPKIRNPKLEIRNKPEGPKSESQNQAARAILSLWSFRVLNLFRISDFGFVWPQMAGPGVRIPPESPIVFLHRR